MTTWNRYLNDYKSTMDIFCLLSSLRILKLSAAVTASSDLEQVSRNWAQKKLCSLSYSSCPILSNCLLQSPPKFNSAHCSGYSWTVKRLFPKPLQCCFGCMSLLCWKVNHHPSLRSHAVWSSFSSRTLQSDLPQFRSLCPCNKETPS